MLYKVFMDVSHLEDHDRAGIIEAPSIGSAVEILKAHLEETWADIPKTVDSQVETSLAARVTIKATDNLGETAEDVYLVEYAATGILTFQGEHWDQIFS